MAKYFLHIVIDLIEWNRNLILLLLLHILHFEEVQLMRIFDKLLLKLVLMMQVLHLINQMISNIVVSTFLHE